jgi:hypothetical protein
MTHQSQLDALIAYIEQQRHSADRATIKQHLLQSGADPHVVEQAFIQVYGADRAAEPTPLAPPSTPDPESIARIRGYLEEHRRVYDRDALRNKLLADGHPVQAVESAIAQVYGFEVKPTDPPRPRHTTTVVLTSLGLFIVNYIIWFLITVSTFQSDSLAALILIPALLLLEGVAAFALRRRNPSVARGFTWGIAISLLPIVALALLFGICLAIIGGAFP